MYFTENNENFNTEKLRGKLEEYILLGKQLLTKDSLSICYLQIFVSLGDLIQFSFVGSKRS